MLCDLRDRARELGWKTAIVSAGPNLLLDLWDQVADSSLAANASVGVNAGFVSAKVDVAPKEPSLRKLLSSAAKSSKGLFIAIDEVQDAPIDDMRAIASTVQLLIGEKVDIALAFAGLPAGVMDLINGKALTFLRRAVPLVRTQRAIRRSLFRRPRGVVLHESAKTASKLASTLLS